MRMPRSRPMTSVPSLQTRSSRSPSTWRFFSLCWRYWNVSAPVARHLCYYMCLNSCLMSLCVIPGVWLSCALAWGEAVDRSPEESVYPGPGRHSGQPHGWVHPLHIRPDLFYNAGVLLGSCTFNFYISHFTSLTAAVCGFGGFSPTCFISQVFPD